MITFFRLLYFVLEGIQPFLVPICFIGAWALVSLLAWSIGSAIWGGIKQAKRMHQIPCANCQFFTGDYHLKCTVRPSTALSEMAIDCPDHQPNRHLWS
ncbi:MAG: hypothetical protein VKJ46_11860 [Leptolyngbyaceae bacterium]|nr:hypothetical protein [Leptolyngbyaceae bacterium]